MESCAWGTSSAAWSSNCAAAAARDVAQRVELQVLLRSRSRGGLHLVDKALDLGLLRGPGQHADPQALGVEHHRRLRQHALDHLEHRLRIGLLERIDDQLRRLVGRPLSSSRPRLRRASVE